MKYKPHKYQQYAAQFIIANPIVALFLDMGLGKTSTTLSALDELMYDYFEIGKVLIIAPLRVAKNTWPDEIAKWDGFKFFTYSVVVGTEKERLKALEKKVSLYIINRENVPWLVEKSGMPFDFDMIVVDELSSFKNWQSKRFKSLMKVRPKVKRLVGLTGTPTGSAGYMDLFAQFKLLDMGQRLGRLIGQYRTWYFRPLATNGNIVYSYGLLPGADEMINKKIEDITISMKAEDYLDMPELLPVIFPVELSEKERKAYDGLKKDYIFENEAGEVTAANAAALSGKLCQLANGTLYLDDESVCVVHDRKLDALEDIIESMVGKPLMVVYWYRHDKERIMERLRTMKVRFECLDTDESIKHWNSGELPVCLCHPASSGHGLNLQESGCNTMVFFSTPWSLELYQQTVARLYRQGQQSKTVTVVHIAAKDTIDMKIMQALHEKTMTQEKLIEAVRAEVGYD